MPIKYNQLYLLLVPNTQGRSEVTNLKYSFDKANDDNLAYKLDVLFQHNYDSRHYISPIYLRALCFYPRVFDN